MAQADRRKRGGETKRSRLSRLLRGAAMAAALSAGLAGCATLNDSGVMSTLRGDNDGSTLYGNYLAARFAGRAQDAASAARYYSRALANDPENQDILERAFLLELNAGNMDTAVALARRITAVREDDRLARMVLAANALRHGNHARVRDHAAKAADGPLTDIVNRLLVAWSHAGEGDTEIAVAQLSGLDLVTGLDIYRVFHAALIYDLAGYETLAESQYDEAMTLSNRTSIRVVQAYGRFLERDGRPAQASAIYDAFLADVGNHPLIAASAFRVGRGDSADVNRLVPSTRAGAAEAIYALAGALAREQERGPDLPIVYLRLALFLRPDFPIAQSMLADLLERNDRIEAATIAYRGVSRDSALWANARIRIAHGLNRLERKDEAIAVLEDVIEIAPQNQDVLISIADLHAANEHYGAAADYYARAVAQIETVEDYHWALFYQYGIALERSKRWNDAEVFLKKALELRPEQPFVLNYLGYSWIDQGRNLDEAMEMIRTAAALEPDNGYIIDSLGWGYYRLGEYDLAVERLEQAVMLAPGDPIINDHLGDAYWMVGRKLEARFQWRHALALDPDEETEERAARKLQIGLTDEDLIGNTPTLQIEVTDVSEEVVGAEETAAP